MRGQRPAQWPRQTTGWELRPAEGAEWESGLEMRPESRPDAEPPSALSGLQQGGEKTRNVVKQDSNIVYRPESETG